MTLPGDTLTTADFRGKVILICFWATWCGPCRTAFADLDSLWNEFSGTGRFALVAISLDSTPGVLESYLEGQAHDFIITRGSGIPEIGTAYEVRGIPTYYVLDTRGYQVERVVGLHTLDTMRDIVSAALNPLPG